MKNIFETKIFTDIKNKIGDIAFVNFAKALEGAFFTNGAIKIALIGEAGVGKTSTVNALFGTNFPVSHVKSCTQEDQHIKTTTKKGVEIEVIDMPGLWAGEAETEKHWETYRRILPTVDCAIWVLSAGDRALEGMQNALKKISQFADNELINNIVFGVNKSEHMHPEDWNNTINLPSDEQDYNLQQFCDTVKDAIKESFPAWNGTIVYYSARKHFRLEELLEQMLVNASIDNRLKVLSASEPKRYEDMVEDKRALEEAKKMIKEDE